MNKEKKICYKCRNNDTRICPWYNRNLERTGVKYMNFCSAFQPDYRISFKDKLLSPYKLKLHLVCIKKKFKSAQEALTDLDSLIKQIDKKIEKREVG